MASWQTALCPFEIEFSAHKLDEIRIAVIEGFYAVPKGGIEIGGVLYGTREDRRLKIEGYRKIETEYLTGPSFHLSKGDKAGLKEMLAPGERGLTPVGWFLSHTRSGICLSPRDLSLHEEFFPEPWQVALVLTPDKLGPVRGGYFFRGTDGRMKVDKSALEFTLQPVVLEKPRAEGEHKVVEIAATGPAPVAEQTMPPMFQSIGREPAARNRWLTMALGLAAIAAILAGYLTATR